MQVEYQVFHTFFPERFYGFLHFFGAAFSETAQPDVSGRVVEHISRIDAVYWNFIPGDGEVNRIDDTPSHYSYGDFASPFPPQHGDDVVDGEFYSGNDAVIDRYDAVTG